ncbi:MAG: TetR/AcrR family transcriptional regulator, partial [Parvibaculaceae bacterium]|nr:TetR/AcrR family transcriptional regulator [Parvibaculaceae bacterium]
MSARHKLLAAAEELFDQQSYDSTSVAQLCTAAGVSNGSFFHAFRTKDALAAQLYLAALEDYHAALAVPLGHNPAAKEGIAALIRAHLNWVVDNRRQAEFLFNQSRSDWLVHISE